MTVIATWSWRPNLDGISVPTVASDQDKPFEAALGPQ
jgi:hypothetical protein